MPDTLPVFRASPVEAARLVGHNRERRSPCSGLPILSTEPMNQVERDALRQLVRALRLSADRIDEALDRGRVEHGLEALQLVDAVQLAAGKVAVQLGRGR